MDRATPESSAVIDLSEAGVLRIATLARPEQANALDPSLVAGLSAFVQQATEDGRPFALAGERVFCGGFDLGGFEQQSEGDLLLRFVRLELLLQSVSRAPVPSFALIAGAAIGAGADLAVACTYRIGTRRARFRFPGFRFGVALGTRRLAAIVGTDRARAILLADATVGAEEALAIGLLTHLVEEDELLPSAERLVAAQSGLTPPATARILGLTGPDTGDADLADLVRSLAAPGLRGRIASYLAGKTR